VENEFEHIEMAASDDGDDGESIVCTPCSRVLASYGSEDIRGVQRVREALHSNMWECMIKKGAPRSLVVLLP
jgi:hypothetical protein